MSYELQRIDEDTVRLQCYFSIFDWISFCERREENPFNYGKASLVREWFNWKFIFMHKLLVDNVSKNCCRRAHVRIEDDSITCNVYNFFCNPLHHNNFLTCVNGSCDLWPYLGGYFDDVDDNNNLFD